MKIVDGKPYIDQIKGLIEEYKASGPGPNLPESGGRAGGPGEKIYRAGRRAAGGI